MRGLKAALLAMGVAGLFAAACSSSTPTGSTGGTSGGATTGGSSTAGTNGGTTGGTSGLAAGAACSGNAQCLSNICGIGGIGHCCSAQCATSDATCGASACDDTGACTYPASTTSCGTPSCTGSMLTASDCNGSGSCAAHAPAACPDNLNCADAQSCLASCTTSADCVSGFYCNGGSCVAALSDGTACTSNASCQSSVCGPAGTGNCCHAACATTDLTCGATACDGTGACAYPPNTTSCGVASCSGGNMLTTSDCDGSGTCTASAPVACPNHLNCAGATSCLTSCTTTADCVGGFWCSGGACIAVLADGTSCGQNDACTSGVCGLNGSGNCCHAACATADLTCGATACDATGACTYPVATTPCGTPPTCSGNTLTSNFCNAAGTCASNGGVACPNNLACNGGGTACNTACTTVTQTTDCVSGDFCDPTAFAACCPALNPGAVMSIDNAQGNDATLCCGYGAAGPCQTLTRAMNLVTGTNNYNTNTLVTLTATIDGGGGDWSTETYPVSLSWGITLSAAGVYFSDAVGGAAEMFDVVLGTTESPGNPVTIGVPIVNANDQVVIGADSSANFTSDFITISVEAGQTLSIFNAQVLEEAFFGLGKAIDVQSGATLDIGGSLFASGTLWSGGTALPNGTAITYGFFDAPGTGIYCNGNVSDSLFAGGLVSTAQGLGIDAEDNCVVSLNNSPIFGTPTGGTGWTNCSAGPPCGGCNLNPPPDGTAVLANGSNATVNLYGAAISCMNAYGVEVTYSSNAGLTQPQVVVGSAIFGGNSSIQNCAGAGVYSSAGSIYVESATLLHNYRGVDMEVDANSLSGNVYLNDNSSTQPSTNTTVNCSSNQEPNPNPTVPGFDVYLNSAGAFGGQWVNWDWWYDPSVTNTQDYTADIFVCDVNLVCTCDVFDDSSNPACMNTAGSDDLDLVIGASYGGGGFIGNGASTDGAQTGPCQ